ncbi:YSIRK-type signal peptide-containing protein [Lactobacillus sp. ESL0791]|uniref:YSIRK-type signal peptide-containing protein n=1 Tax=Lactobacillus sp. ESL0791 TaxID=2983234 RepID=UPI0023F7CD59|nr:YSIRK-type signal peptide-containing protein [Lactobacillus sp. ESL0791]MDF7639187.1 YSIRK-type signal peptide-containing protein [Lactobacillus sp. ESL0791]
MLGKSNFSEKLKTVEMQSKRDRFSIRKLAVGTASVLIGFSFMGAASQMAKADTVGSGSQEADIEDSRQTESKETGLNISDNAGATTNSKKANNVSKADVTTYSGLKSFLHDGSEQTASTKEIESPTAESRAETKSADSAANLATAATDLQAEIKKGNDFVATEPFKQAAEDRQKAVTDAITQGQDVLDKYNKFVDTNDAAFKVSLFDLTDAKTTISVMITAATNNVDAQITPRMALPNFGGWALDYNNGTLKINAVSSTNKVNGSSLLTTYLSTNGVKLARTGTLRKITSRQLQEHHFPA